MDAFKVFLCSVGWLGQSWLCVDESNIMVASRKGQSKLKVEQR